MRASDRLGAAVMAAMALSLAPLTAVTTDRALFAGALVLIGVIGVTGMVTRRLLRGDVLAGCVQAAVGFVVWLGLAVASGLPGPSALPRVLDDALEWTMTSSAPMEANLGVRLVATFALGLLAFLADQLAVSYGQATWTLLTIGVPYLVPALALPGMVGFTTLVAPALGYVLVLATEAGNRVRALQGQSQDQPGRGLLAGSLACLLVATPLAGVAGVVTPGVDDSRGAPFAGYGPVQMGDPSLDLRRNLQLPANRRILSYTTSTGMSTRLRMTSLPSFDASGFHLDPIDLYGGPLPAPPGAPPGRAQWAVDVTVDDFQSEWLPLPYAPSSFSASGEWRHDPVSLSVLAAGGNRKQATSRLRYQASVVDVNPTAAQLAAANAGVPENAETTAALPGDLPARISELARTITRGAATDGAKAILIQNWLRSPVFTYSTEPAAGSGYDALTRFLFDDRTGYCEQFASSMAVLARAAGIPSRVAIGFLPGRPTGNGWAVSIRDMHAWPELYFAGLGWVSFEPTPGVATPPEYTTGSGDSTPSPSPSISDVPEPEISEPTIEPEETDEQPDAAEAEAAGPNWPAWSAGGLLLLVVVGATPWAVRRARRRHRLAPKPPRAAVAAAWDEVRDSVWDAGGEWPRGSARRIGDELARDLPADAGAALGRVALLVERSRYAETLGEVGDLGADVTQVRAGIARGETGPRWWHRLAPRSLWRRLRWRG